jgi:hypothetical protein
MTGDRELILKAAELARSAPRIWNEFLGALSNYSNQQKDNCIQSPLEQLPVAQGRAQLAAHLHGVLATCIQSADKIEGKRK